MKYFLGFVIGVVAVSRLTHATRHKAMLEAVAPLVNAVTK
jgi:uncharacterized protein (UPF0303 family)